jgi:hypothetical protein
MEAIAHFLDDALALGRAGVIRLSDIGGAVDDHL